MSSEPQWDPIQQIYVGGIVPENAEVQALIKKNGGYLRLFGYGSLCWNPGTGALAKEGVVGTLGRARGYKRCWAQKSTDHRGRPEFPGIVCTLLQDSEVYNIRNNGHSRQVNSDRTPTMTEGVIYLIPPELVEDCLNELDFREKGGYARDVIDVVEDKTGETHQALLYRGTPDNPAIWERALLDLPLAAAVMAVSEGPSGKNDVYLNRLDSFLSNTHTIAADNDDTMSLANMTRYFQTKSQLYFAFGSGSNQHNQLLLNRPNNAALLKNDGEDAHEMKEIVICCPISSDGQQDRPTNLYAGGGHSGLLCESGKLYLWGWNDAGQLAQLSSIKKTHNPLPVQQALPLAVATAAFGFNHTLVVEKSSRKLFAFGSNDCGQVTGTPLEDETLGINTPQTPYFLKNIKVKACAAGLFHSAVVSEDGELLTFGNGQFGQCLASEDGIVGRWKPSDGSLIMGVACGRRHTLVSDDKGRIWSLGENKYGQLGRILDGQKYDATPAIVEGLPAFPKDSNIVLSCGWSHSVVQIETPTKTKELYGWGRNDKGQLGLGMRDHILQPTKIFEGIDILSVACGSESTMVVDIDERILGCGWNEHGNLATTDIEDRLVPTQACGARIVGPTGLYDGKVTLAVGGGHVLAARLVEAT